MIFYTFNAKAVIAFIDIHTLAAAKYKIGHIRDIDLKFPITQLEQFSD